MIWRFSFLTSEDGKIRGYTKGDCDMRGKRDAGSYRRASFDIFSSPPLSSAVGHTQTCRHRHAHLPEKQFQRGT